MKKKETKADKLRKWGLPYPSFQWHHLRWKTPPEKGALWWHFSLKIRNRDIEKYGVCICCGKLITLENTDCAHFIPASVCGRDLLFDELNNNAACRHCNGFDESHYLRYEIGLDKRFGDGTAQSLKDRWLDYKKIAPVKDFTRAEYEEKLREYVEM